MQLIPDTTRVSSSTTVNQFENFTTTISPLYTSIPYHSNSVLETAYTATNNFLTSGGTGNGFSTSGGKGIGSSTSGGNGSGFFMSGGNGFFSSGENGSGLLTGNDALTEPFLQRIIIASVLTLIASAALLGNVSLWIIVCREHTLQTTSNALILCLSAADLLVSAINMPTTVVAILFGGWPFSPTACVVLGFTTMTTFIASVMSLGVISINRFVLICYPVHFKLLYTPRRTALMIAGTWLLSILLACPPLFGWGVYDYLEGQSFCFCDWKTSLSYTIFMVAVCFGGPCTVMTFCYMGILRKFRSTRRKIQTSSLYSPRSVTQVKEIQSINVGKSSISHGSTALAPQTQDPGGEKKSGLIIVQDVQDEPVSQEVVKDRKVTTMHELSREKETLEFTGNHLPAMSHNKSLDSTQSEGHLQAKNVTTSKAAFQKEERTNTAGDLNQTWASPREGIVRKSRAKDGTLPDPREKTLGAEKVITDTLVSPRLSVTSSSRENIKDLQVNGEDKRRSSILKNRGKEDRRLTITLLVIIFIFIICWLPFCVTMFLSVFSPYPVPRIPDILTLLLGCFNSSCNPIVYGIMNKRFLDGYKRLFCCACRKCQRTDVEDLNQAVPQSFQESLQ